MKANLDSTQESAPSPVTPPDFSHLAKIYRWMELFSFGPWLERCRTAFLLDISACRSALVLGDGDGRFTAQLLRKNPFIHVDAVDASPAMLSELLRRAGTDSTRVDVHPADARTLNFPGSQYDLIATHFFLDCLTDQEFVALAMRLRFCVAPGALWVVSEFAVPPNLFGKFVARPLIAALYRIFGAMTGLKIRSIPNYPAILLQNGFVLTLKRSLLAGLLVSELWSATPSSAETVAGR
jgi:ubiquinone/menaquinone biosynthesis C-methylase UbiE